MSVLEATREKWPDTYVDFSHTLGVLNSIQRSVFFEMMKYKLPNIIKSHTDFADVMMYFTSEQRSIVFDTMKDIIPAIIQKLDESKFNNLLRYFSPEQRETITGIKHLMAAFDKEITVFASALMSDNNTRIKAEFDHLIQHSETQVELLAALSRLEPRWMEKINVAVGLKLAGTQLTSQPDIEAAVKQYVNHYLDTRSTVTQQYKQSIKLISDEHEREQKESKGDVIETLRPSDYKKIAVERRNKKNVNSANSLSNKLGKG